MTTDERLARLTERHEALTQSVELLLVSERQTRQRMEDGFSRIEGMIEKLVTVMESHERRLSDLEGR